MPTEVEIEGLGTVEFPDEMTPEAISGLITNEIVPRHQKAVALRAEQEKVRGQDKLARWFGEDRPIIPPALIEADPSLSTFLRIKPPAGPVGTALRVAQSAARTGVEAATSMTAPSMLPVAPVALVPGGGEAMGLYFGGQALGAGLGQLSAAQTPEEVGAGLGQVAIAAPMVIGGVRGRPLARYQRAVPPVLEPAAPAAQSEVPPVPVLLGEQPVTLPPEMLPAGAVPRAVKPRPLPGPLDVVVPGTAAEPYETVIQTIRRAGARTKHQIQDLFPERELTREEAGALRVAAWGKEPDASGIRTDTGLAEAARQVAERGEADRGSDVQQAAPIEPQPVEARGQAEEAGGPLPLTPKPAAEPAPAPGGPAFLDKTKAEWTLEAVFGQRPAILSQLKDLKMAKGLTEKSPAATFQKRIFAAIDAKEKAAAKPTPAPAEPAPAPAAEPSEQVRLLMSEGLSTEQASAVLSGKKTPAQVVEENLSEWQERMWGAREAGETGTIEHNDAVRLAMEQATERIQDVVEGRKPGEAAKTVSPSVPAVDRGETKRRGAIIKRLRDAQRLLNAESKRAFGAATVDAEGRRLISADGTWQLKYYAPGEKTPSGEIAASQGDVVIEATGKPAAPVPPAAEPAPAPAPAAPAEAQPAAAAPAAAPALEAGARGPYKGRFMDDSFAEQSKGYPKAREVLKGWSNQALAEERAVMIKASLDPMFGGNAKKVLALLDDEIAQRQHQPPLRRPSPPSQPRRPYSRCSVTPERWCHQPLVTFDVLSTRARLPRKLDWSGQGKLGRV